MESRIKKSLFTSITTKTSTSNLYAALAEMKTGNTIDTHSSESSDRRRPIRKHKQI